MYGLESSLRIQARVDLPAHRLYKSFCICDSVSLFLTRLATINSILNSIVPLNQSSQRLFRHSKSAIVQHPRKVLTHGTVKKMPIFVISSEQNVRRATRKLKAKRFRLEVAAFPALARVSSNEELAITAVSSTRRSWVDAVVYGPLTATKEGTQSLTASSFRGTDIRSARHERQPRPR
jgi:hypothetical protein